MRTFMLIFIAAFCRELLAQQVVTTAGCTNINSIGSISYTIGEGIAQTFKQDDKIITQGFHQTTISVSLVNELENLDFTISVFPNPSSDELTLKITKENVSGLQYLLFDPTGKLMIHKKLESAETKVSLQRLIDGFYFLKVQSGTIELKTFKIIKK